MDGVSGFTFIHNGVEGGYPFVEAIAVVKPYVDEMVVVDMQSTDETRYVLEQLNVRIIDGIWTPGAAGECLKVAHAMHTQCENEIIWHFEADEVFDPYLAASMHILLDMRQRNLSVPRLQLEQNFQRCRWYPDYVHRVFYNGSVCKEGHTTDYIGPMDATAIKSGYLWDITNCFRDDWTHRLQNQAELWGAVPQFRAVGLHANDGFGHIQNIKNFLDGSIWTWESSPFALPESLVELVGVVSYKEHLREVGLL